MMTARRRVPAPAFRDYQDTLFRGAEFIWTSNLDLDNQVVCRKTVQSLFSIPSGPESFVALRGPVAPIGQSFQQETASFIRNEGCTGKSFRETVQMEQPFGSIGAVLN